MDRSTLCDKAGPHRLATRSAVASDKGQLSIERLGYFLGLRCISRPQVLFYARSEVSQLGSSAVEPEHILLGVLDEGKGFGSGILARTGVALDDFRSDIVRRLTARDKVPESDEIPFSASCERALQYATEEADRLLHNYVGTEHLGAEISGAATTNADLNRGQLQLVVGASYELRKNLNVDVGFIAGRFAASPREGVQVGFSVDLPRGSTP